MAGKKGASGRRRAIGSINGENAMSLALRSFIQAMEDPNISNLEKAKLAMPVVAKRFADKVESTQIQVELSNELAEQFLTIYSRNQEIYESLAGQQRMAIQSPNQPGAGALGPAVSALELGASALGLSPLASQQASKASIQKQGRPEPGFGGPG